MALRKRDFLEPLKADPQAARAEYAFNFRSHGHQSWSRAERLAPEARTPDHAVVHECLPRARRWIDGSGGTSRFARAPVFRSVSEVSSFDGQLGPGDTLDEVERCLEEWETHRVSAAFISKRQGEEA